MPKGSLNVSLKGADEIFSTEESRQEQQREQVQQIPILKFASHGIQRTFLGDSTARTTISKPTAGQTAVLPTAL